MKRGYVNIITYMPIIEEEPMYFVDKGDCSGCGICEDACPRGAIRIEGGVAAIDQSICDQCGSCFTACPQGAIYEEETAVAVFSPGTPAKKAVQTGVSRENDARVVSGRKLPRLLAALTPAALEVAMGLARTVVGVRRSRISRKRAGIMTRWTSLEGRHRYRFRGGNK